ncbi:Multiple sugar-binding protein [Paenibacillus sp. CECT 9249]|uniref:ABC transporter substrate-binding protein n=1 Tax=Paenibacillus sp. CECT 9249 TaxID=2845385 RepID=UPI001E50CB1A|nr:extracellular solute-binding protein [Paenibacillus sp. CECT 9249]CAH0121565.1 Multiple sugar-binding protein [Paenibacillus sp. CECT 9249]
MKKALAVVAAVVLLAGVMSACGSKSEQNTANRADTKTGGESLASTKPVQLTWVHHFGEEGARKWIDLGIQKFKENNPNIDVEVIATEGGTTYKNFFNTKVAANDVPDIYMIDDIPGYQEIIDAGYAADLTGQPFLGNIGEQYLNGVKSEDGKIWALPIDTNGGGVTYNKDAFAKAGITEVPKTYSEFLAVCEKLKAAGIVPIAAGFKDSWVISWDINPDLLVTGVNSDTDWIKDVEAGKATFADNKGHFKEVLTRFVQRLPYMNDDPMGTNWDKVQELVASGKAAMVINGTWAVDGAKSKNPDANIGLFAFPSTENPDDAKFAMKSTGGIVVNPKSKNKEAALKLLETFSTPEVGEIFQNNKKGISVIKGLKPDFDPTYVELDANYLKPGKTFDWSQFSPDFVSTELGNAYVDGLTSLILDKNHDVDKAIKQLDDNFNKIRPLQK